MSYVTIKGEGLKFNQGALMLMTEKSADADAFSIYAIVWAGLKSNAYVKEKEFTKTFEEVCDWCDELTLDEQKQIVESFKETQAFKNLLPKDEKKEEAEEIKKNVEHTEPIVSGLLVE